MVKRDEKKTLIFMHIPKTAGSTLHQLFHSNYKAEEIFKLGVTGSPKEGRFSERHSASLEKLKSLTNEEQANIRAVVGHAPYGLHENFSCGAQYITVLRHPLNRILSHYYFVKDNPNHYLHQRLLNEAPSIADYVTKLKSKELNNGMLRFFLGAKHVEIPFGECRRDMVDVALERIDKSFVGVGFQEYFDESVELFCDINNWSKPDIKSKNTSKSSYEKKLSAKELESILRYNSLDLVLYEELLKKFLKRKS